MVLLFYTTYINVDLAHNELLKLVKVVLMILVRRISE